MPWLNSHHQHLANQESVVQFLAETVQFFMFFQKGLYYTSKSVKLVLQFIKQTQDGVIPFIRRDSLRCTIKINTNTYTTIDIVIQ